MWYDNILHQNIYKWKEHYNISSKLRTIITRGKKGWQNIKIWILSLLEMFLAAIFRDSKEEVPLSYFKEIIFSIAEVRLYIWTK